MTEEHPVTQDVPPDYTAPIGPEDNSGFVDIIPEPESEPAPPQPVVDQPAEHED
jgi:hypothetical protein